MSLLSDNIVGNATVLHCILWEVEQGGNMIFIIFYRNLGKAGLVCVLQMEIMLINQALISLLFLC